MKLNLRIHFSSCHFHFWRGCWRDQSCRKVTSFLARVIGVKQLLLQTGSYLGWLNAEFNIRDNIAKTKQLNTEKTTERVIRHHNTFYCANTKWLFFCWGKDYNIITLCFIVMPYMEITSKNVAGFYLASTRSSSGYITPKKDMWPRLNPWEGQLLVRSLFCLKFQKTAFRKKLCYTSESLCVWLSVFLFLCCVRFSDE